MSDDTPSPGSSSMSAHVLAQLAEASERLRSRRYERFAIEDLDRIFTDVQGRGWGSEATLSNADIADLTSSIASVGLLQPVQLEYRKQEDLYLLVTGERRLRAMRWGMINEPDNPHFAEVETVVVDGPLTEEDKFHWQAIENIARVDLKPGELAAALLYLRCARLAIKLVGHDVDPSAALHLDCPIARWTALDKLRVQSGLHKLGVSWRELIQQLGLQMSPHTAEQTVRAFRSLPAELSSEMDANDVSLASRREFLRLRSGRAEAASAIWEALAERGRTDLLTRSCQEAQEHPVAEVDDVIALAEKINSRSSPPPSSVVELASTISDELVDQAKTSIEALLSALRAGARLPGYNEGSFVLYAAELQQLLGESTEETRLAS